MIGARAQEGGSGKEKKKSENERVMERKKKKQQPDNDSGSDGELNSLSSGGNDMKPVIYRRLGWWERSDD